MSGMTRRTAWTIRMLWLCLYLAGLVGVRPACAQSHDDPALPDDPSLADAGHDSSGPSEDEAPSEFAPFDDVLGGGEDTPPETPTTGPWVSGIGRSADAVGMAPGGVRHVIDLHTIDVTAVQAIVQYHATRRLGLCLTLRWVDPADNTRDKAPTVSQGRAALDRLLAVVNTPDAKKLGSLLWIQFYGDLRLGPGAVAPEDLDSMFDFATRAVRRLGDQEFAGRFCGPTVDGRAAVAQVDADVGDGGIEYLATARTIRWSQQFADALDVRIAAASGADASRMLGKVARLVATLSDGRSMRLVSWQWNASAVENRQDRDGAARVTRDIWAALLKAGVRPAAYGPCQDQPMLSEADLWLVAVDASAGAVEPIFSTLKQLSINDQRRADSQHREEVAGRPETAPLSAPVEVRPVYAGSTRLGVSGGLNPEMLADVGVKTARVILTGPQVRDLLDEQPENGAPTFIDRLKALKSDGYEVILTIRWPASLMQADAAKGKSTTRAKGSTAANPKPPATSRPRTSSSKSRSRKPAPVPVYKALGDFDAALSGQAREDAILIIEDLLNGAGSAIDWIQVQNEAVGVAGMYSIQDMIFDPRRTASPAVDWMRAVATRINELRRENPALANLKIMGPALRESVILDRLRGGRTVDSTDGKVLTAFIDEVIKFAETHTDALDLHLHVASPEDAQAVIDYVRERSQVQLTCTEFSPEAAGEAWLRKSAQDPGALGNVSNSRFVQDAYADQVSQKLWDRFIASSPVPHSYPRDIFTVLSRAGFVHACYGSVYQVGSVRQDWKALYATLTVGGKSCRSGSIWKDFNDLARELAARGR